MPCGARREGESWFKLVTASAFYRLIFRITDVKIPLDTGDFRLLDRKVVNVLCDMRERHRFLRGMASWVGYRQVGVEYDRKERFAGKDQVSFQQNVQTGTERQSPVSRIFRCNWPPIWGFICAGISIVAIPIVVFLRLVLSGSIAGPGHHAHHGVVPGRRTVDHSGHFS